MKHHEPPLKRVPIELFRLLVDKALDQPRPTRDLQSTLQMILEQGEHKDRLR